MHTEDVEYYSEGQRVRALWRTPDSVDGPLPAIIHGPGWLGLKDAKVYERYHEAFTGAGFGVLAIDYRGFGASEGERGMIVPARQLEDLVNGVTYVSTRDDVLDGACGAFATGGTGGGNVVLLGAVDERVQAVVSQFPVADGEDWLRRMRTEHEWVAFKRRLYEDRVRRVLTGESEHVHPREDIMVQTPERVRSGFKADVDERVPSLVPLSVVDGLLQYRPIDAARGMSTPVMLVAVEDDTTTPASHARAIYDVAAGPKCLVMQRHTSHYAAYDDYAQTVIPEMVDWFRTHLIGRGDVQIFRQEGGPRPQALPQKER